MVYEELLGLDVGTKRIGVARVNSVAGIPEALPVVATEQAAAKLPELIARYSSQAVIVGLPRGMQGQDTAQTKLVRNWVKQAKRYIPLPLFWQDEAVTSLNAETLRQKGRSAKAGDNVDSLAACLLLQDFLSAPVQARWEV